MFPNKKQGVGLLLGAGLLFGMWNWMPSKRVPFNWQKFIEDKVTKENIAFYYNMYREEADETDDVEKRNLFAERANNLANLARDWGVDVKQ